MPKPPPKITFQLDEPSVRRGNGSNRRLERTLKASSPVPSSWSDEESSTRLNSPLRLSEARPRTPKKVLTLSSEETHPHRQPHQNNNMLLSFTKNLDTPPIKTPPPPREALPLAIKPRPIEEQPKVFPSTYQRTVHSTSSFANRSKNDTISFAGNDELKPRAGSALLGELGFIQPTSPSIPHHSLTKTSSPDVSYSQPSNSHMSGINYNPSFEANVKSPLTSPTGAPQGYGSFEANVSSELVFGPRQAYLANGPLNAIATSSSQDFVAVAGREVLKILDLSGEVMTESLNLRVGYRLNLNFSSTDVDWGVGYCRDRLATAATNGTVVLWDLNKTGQKIERLITEHTRAVHRVKFHPATGTTLFSASQDGTLKAWDVRTKDPARMTFFPKAEAVRDFRFNPLHPDEFVAAFDNGSIQIWDIRQPSHHVKKLTAHSGITLAVDWHHDGRTVASGGRDKLIKIWDTKSDSRKPTGLIQTIAPVASVRWRPHHGYQLASTSLNTDYSVNVWDTHRPYISRYSVVGHTNVTTDIIWASQDLLLSCSKDQLLLRRALDQKERSGAKEPILYLPPSAVNWNPYGDLGFVVDRPSHPPDPRPERRKALASRLHLTSSFDKHFRIAPTQTSGVLHLPIFDYATFATLALHYSLDSRDTIAATEHNYRAAFETGHLRTAQTWKILQLIRCKFTNDHLISPYPSGTSNRRNQSASSLISSHRLPETDEPVELDEWLEGIQLYDALSDGSDDLASSLLPPGKPSAPTTPGHLPITMSLSATPNSLSPDASVHGGSPPTHAEDIFPMGWDTDQVIMDLLAYYASEGDVQMCCTAVMVLGDRLPVQQRQKELWIHSYVELLHRFKLWVPATAILGACGIPELSSRNQESTTIYTLCWQCHRPLLGSEEAAGFWGCGRCSQPISNCTICHKLVKGLYSWCQGCGHGGHLGCYQDWFSPETGFAECPSGCGHVCNIVLSH
ncbi:SEA (Seh1-associated) complex subunit [Entomophthora muscae]|uniref:SEA (Seh1-associated) complex subunit n=1 Tax=Entomophthora muscae TaxID=34485 RepID=A0ACC2SSI4_9FUNG|nr:SEA (Seh1-associated) complex subunit [Entomophthora muscae]